MNNYTNPSVQLVVTIPDSFGPVLAYRTRCRTTMGVLTQLIVDAKRHLIIAAPFMQAGHGLSSGTLAFALKSALKRGVIVDVMSTRQSLQTIDKTDMENDLKQGLRFFQAGSHIQDDYRLGSHAKFCVADGNQAYVGSANLTGPGLGGQVEMGILIEGTVAQQIKNF